MASSHLDRTGFRHAVLGIGALGALVAAMWTSSSFVGPLSSHPFSQTPEIQHAYSVGSRYSIALIVLNAFTALIITITTLVVDWHFDVRLPAYAEYAWIALVLCVEIVALTLAGISAPPGACFSEGSTQQMSPSDIVSGQAICSNWNAILFSTLIPVVTLTFHLAWHIIFRAWHRATLANRPATPVDMWKTPLPRNYPIDPREKQKDEDPNFMALEENSVAPVDSDTLDPYNLMFAPVAARKVQRSAQEAAKEHAAPIPSARVSAEDLTANDNASFVSSKAGELIPPGLEIAIETRKSYPKEST